MGVPCETEHKGDSRWMVPVRQDCATSPEVLSCVRIADDLTLTVSRTCACVTAYGSMRRTALAAGCDIPHHDWMQNTKDMKDMPQPHAAQPGAAAPGTAAGSSDESIGRPANWREGRYQRSGTRVDESVNQPSQTGDAPHDTVGTQTPPASSRANRPKSPPAERLKPVTLRDYEK